MFKMEEVLVSIKNWKECNCRTYGYPWCTIGDNSLIGIGAVIP